MNLLKEVKQVLKENGKSVKDVKWIGNSDFYFTYEDFKEIAQQVEYDDGFGHQQIPDDLLIVGDYWWLERDEYDGAEWFEFKELPDKPFKYLQPNFVSKNDAQNGGSSLSQINQL